MNIQIRKAEKRRKRKSIIVIPQGTLMVTSLRRNFSMRLAKQRPPPGPEYFPK